MIMTPWLRKLVLTVHVISSVGWLGAVVAYLVLDLTAVTSRDLQTVRAAYTGMELTIWFAIVPLAALALLIGFFNALGTSWGLFRHYWVLVKLLLTIVATGILMLEAPKISQMADAAAVISDPRELPGSLPHSIGAILFLFVITVLALYKPRGMTRYGWRKRHERPIASANAGVPG